MKKIFRKSIVVAMAFLMTLSVFQTSKLVAYANEVETSVTGDVKIELIQNGQIVESGTNVLMHKRNYTRSSNKSNGDEILITAPEGVHYLMVQLDKYCGIPKTSGMLEEEQVEGSVKPSNMNSLEYEETLVYLIDNEFRFVVPGTTGQDAAGNNLGGGSWPYDSRAFATSGNTEKVITARVATEEEINAYRNLALNPFDLRGNDNAKSGANKRSDINVFPHAFANRVTDNKREFEPRNAIDGFEYNASHVGFPYQSWGCGNEKTDSEFSVLFGRYVEIDQIDITVRAQWNPPQPNNANDHDINWESATLEFSDGTEMPIKLEKLASPQRFKLPEKKVVSWVRVKDLPVTDEIIPVDGRKKFAALTEFKVWGKEASMEDALMPSGEQLVTLAKKVNDYWVKTGGNTGEDATNYNHGHSVTSEFWAPSVFYTGNMEAYYLTGDENYTDYAKRWGSNNIYDGKAWNTKADSGRIGKYFPDNHTSFQTYLDMFSICSDTGFDPTHEMIANVVPIMEEMEQMSISELKNQKGYWDRVDFLYMELPNWTKMYLLTKDEKYLDKQRELFDDRKAQLYDEESGLFYRDSNYIYDPNASYNPNGDGSFQKISPNGKKILWSRGNGWAMAALARVMQDLPDHREEDRAEYEAVFKKMAETLIKVQGEDGFWRMNLDDYAHDTRPETSGTVFFAYGLAWGINNGLLDFDTYYPALRKAFLGLNANGIRPDGLVGRSELISAYPNPKCSLGIGSSQSYAPAATVLFLSELSKLESQGYVSNDVEPALNKKMIGAIAVKEGSKYAVVNSRIKEMVTGSDVVTIVEDGKVYIPEVFAKEVYGDIKVETIMKNDTAYVSLEDIAGENKQLVSSLTGDVFVASYKNVLFLPTIDTKLVNLLNQGLTDGTYPERPEYEIRFDYTEPPKRPEPSKDALIAIQPNANGALSAQKEIGPNTENVVSVEFDMISVVSPSQTNAIVGLGDSNSNYTAYGQVPIIIRMYKDGFFSYYDGKGYKTSTVRFTQNEKYHIKVSVNLEAKQYSVSVVSPDGKEQMIAENAIYRSSAKVPSNIGKIYLFNNDQAEGSYWLENIKMNNPLYPSENALVAKESNLSGGNSAQREIGPSSNNPVTVEFDMVSAILPKSTNTAVGLGSKDSNYTGYSQTPIIIRMYQGTFGAYTGTGYVQSSVTFKDNELYHVRIVVDLEAERYSVYVTGIDGKEQIVAENYAYRSSAKAPSDIGKIYLFNNDKPAGSYWLENIVLKEEKPVDKETLNETITEAEKLNEENYTPNSWEAFSEILKVAKAVAKDEKATQEEVNEAVETLNTAIKNLEYKEADYTALNDILEEAEALVKENYVDFSEVAKALETAKALPEDLKITEQKQIDEVVSAIKNAMNNLELKKADYTKVDEAIKKAEAKLEEDIYTEASVKVVEDAINAVVRDLDITKQAEVDAMATAIEEAIANLQEKPEEPKPADKSELEGVMKEAEELNAEDYTKESYEALVEALEAAKTVAKDENATQEEVDAVLAKLTAAIDGLQLVEPTDPDKPTIPEEDNKPGEEGEGPDSGDSTNVGGLLTLLGLAGIAIAYETRKRMR